MSGISPHPSSTGRHSARKRALDVYGSFVYGVAAARAAYRKAGLFLGQKIESTHEYAGKKPAHLPESGPTSKVYDGTPRVP